jgi:hypothetical protein
MSMQPDFPPHGVLSVQQSAACYVTVVIVGILTIVLRINGRAVIACLRRNLIFTAYTVVVAEV